MSILAGRCRSWLPGPRARALVLTAPLALLLGACSEPAEEATEAVAVARPEPAVEPPHQTAWRNAPHPREGDPRLDIAFCLDATGSMGDLIDAAKARIRDIHQELSGGPSSPSVRFGVVAYRDRGDRFVTRLWGFTPDPEQARQALAEVVADGGGDDPEHVVAGLRRAVEDLDWDPNARVRFLFLVGDAHPHLDYGEESDVAPVLALAEEKGIVIGALVYGEGMPEEGHRFWRQVADATGGPTEGVAGDAAGLESTLLLAVKREAARQGVRY